MANSIFLDTNGWLALLNRTESMHAQANAVWSDIVRGKHTIVVTDWIVAETGNGLARAKDKTCLKIALERVLQVSRNELIYIGDDLLRKAVDLFGQHADKTWGLVDCASFVVMNERGITQSFTSDRHFEQSGFECMLPGA
jgi:uncharacterized protein